MKQYLLILLFLFLSCDTTFYKLKVMSYNVRHGVSVNWEPSIQKQAGIIKSQSPDWVGLQEIDNYCLRSGAVNQTEWYSDLTGMMGCFGKFMNYDSGEYGMAVLTELKVLKTERLHLPEGAEPRIALVQTVELATNLQLALTNVHFDWTKSELRIPQAQKLIQRLEEIDLPAIVIGDFNAEHGSETIALFQKAGFEFVDKGDHPLTWKANNPSQELDHVCFRSTKKVKFSPIFCKVLNEPEASDHRPIIAEFEIIVK